jgi:hypothetical protein
MELGAEAVLDRRMGGEKALGVGPGLEALHLALSSPDRQVRVFGSVGGSGSSVITNGHPVTLSGLGVSDGMTDEA